MRTLLIRGALGAMVIWLAALAACGGATTSSTEEAIQHQADLYQVAEIERKWHEATSTHDIELMMSLWAANATFTVGPGQTLAGKEEIRRFWLDAPVFQPENLWVSETPAYKLRATVNGDKGTLYFECHYVDAKTGEVVSVTAADQQVARINGEWLITNNVGASPDLAP
jgi:ketosteroid isomerase-like protein